MVSRKAFVVTAAFAALIVLVAGCSHDHSTIPMSPDQSVLSGAEALGQVQFTAQVQTRVEAQRMLTFAGRPDTVIANQNCEVTRLRSGLDEAASFGDIRTGDSVQVFGEKNQNGFVYAYKLRIRWQNSDSCHIGGRVATMERERLMVTLRDCGDTVIVDQNCVCVRQGNRVQIRAGLGEMQVGDSVQINGWRGPDGYVYAHQIRICTSDPTGRWDIAFRDTIASINYAENTLTVTSRSELILVDSNTTIRGILVRIIPAQNTGERSERGGTPNASLAGPNCWGQSFEDSMLTFTDLEVGDVVQIHAVFIDSATLLAKCITLVDCDQVGNKECVQFTDALASIDLAGRLVTFETVGWIGQVCNGARLTGLDGEPLALEDFSVGELVAVKGFPLTGDSLKICQMTKVPVL